MNGPQHYAEAERLVGVAGELMTAAANAAAHADIQSRTLASSAAMSAVAQVHATLALAAATAEGHNKISPYRANEWEQATR